MMRFQPLFSSQASATRPKAQNQNNTVVAHSFIRNNFSITTWLLLGAFMQATLVLLPIRKTYAVAPAFIFLSWQIIDNLLMLFGVKGNTYMNGVIIGKHSAVYPGADGSFQRDGAAAGPGGDEITVVLLSARSNHPLGGLAPGFLKAGEYIASMHKDLERNAAAYGWLGSTVWINAADRATASEIMYVHYFRTREGLQKFSHECAHRVGWDWYNTFARTNKYLAFSHEVYSVPAGRWENIYLNFAPAGLGSTSHAYKDENGTTKWVSPIIDASRGKLRSSAGRMGLDDGAGNEKYGEEPYEAISA